MIALANSEHHFASAGGQWGLLAAERLGRSGGSGQRSSDWHFQLFQYFTSVVILRIQIE